MARPNKEGLEYFPLDTKFDDEIQLIDAKFGACGIGILIKLWQIIYSNGYYIEWTEREKLLYQSRINADIEVVDDVINECLKWGIFDKKIYKNYKILTSRGIQKRFLEATKRRKEVIFIKECSCLGDEKEVNDNIYLVNVDNNPVNVDISTQTEIETEIETDADIIHSIIDYLNVKLGTRYRYSNKSNKAHINARLREGFTLEDFIKVIDKKYYSWNDDPKMQQYLRPETLFGSKFESYLNQKKEKKLNHEGREIDAAIDNIKF